MIGDLLKAIIDLIFWVISLIADIIFTPLYKVVDDFIPNLDVYTNDFYYYFNEYLLKGISFAREVFLNITNIDRGLFNILISIFLLKITTKVVRRLYRFIVNMYGLYKGGPKYPNSRAGGYSGG